MRRIAAPVQFRDFPTTPSPSGGWFMPTPPSGLYATLIQFDEQFNRV